MRTPSLLFTSPPSKPLNKLPFCVIWISLILKLNNSLEIALLDKNK
tara:strand:- start:60 stop:197 length:138 start_codon:yes stop_codon:yes gene_type:complete